jgi:hypothetical protein
MEGCAGEGQQQFTRQQSLKDWYNSENEGK